MDFCNRAENFVCFAGNGGDFLPWCLAGKRERRKEGAEANVRRLRARNLMCAFRRYDAVAEAFLSADFCTSRFGKMSRKRRQYPR